VTDIAQLTGLGICSSELPSRRANGGSAGEVGVPIQIMVLNWVIRRAG
jgi:hypothetical protein